MNFGPVLKGCSLFFWPMPGAQQYILGNLGESGDQSCIKCTRSFGQPRGRSRNMMAASTGFPFAVVKVLLSFYRSGVEQFYYWWVVQRKNHAPHGFHPGTVLPISWAMLSCRPLADLHYDYNTEILDIACDTFLIFQLFFFAWNYSQFHSPKRDSGAPRTLP